MYGKERFSVAPSTDPVFVNRKLVATVKARTQARPNKLEQIVFHACLFFVLFTAAWMTAGVLT